MLQLVLRYEFSIETDVAFRAYVFCVGQYLYKERIYNIGIQQHNKQRDVMWKNKN
jgi:hypothetical protein